MVLKLYDTERTTLQTVSSTGEHFGVVPFRIDAQKVDLFPGISE
jgi:hypothetical protein